MITSTKTPKKPGFSSGVDGQSAVKLGYLEAGIGMESGCKVIYRKGGVGFFCLTPGAGQREAMNFRS